jgi:hypothetical protein
VAEAARDIRSRLTAGGGENVRSASDADREAEKSASCFTDGDREVVGVVSLELALGDDGDEVRSMSEAGRPPWKNIEGLLDLASSASMNLCLALQCDVNAGEVRNSLSQYLQSKRRTGEGGAPGTVYFLLLSTIRWPCNAWAVKPAKVPSGRPRDSAYGGKDEKELSGCDTMFATNALCATDGCRLTSWWLSRFRFRAVVLRMKDLRSVGADGL